MMKADGFTPSCPFFKIPPVYLRRELVGPLSLRLPVDLWTGGQVESLGNFKECGPTDASLMFA